MPSHCSQEFHSRASGLNLALDIDSLGHIQMCKNIKLNISIVGSILAIMNLHFTSSEPLLTPFHICISQCNKISMGCVACFSNSNDADKRTYSLYIGNCISIKFLLWKTCGLLKEIAHPKWKIAGNVLSKGNQDLDELFSSLEHILRNWL